MNRLRSRKNSVGDVGSRSRRPSVEGDRPLKASLASRTFRRKKKPEAEPMPEVNLAEVLPSSDDFRTSLLMPNLSARFSMLREQDDPTSKLGKANDDSVLFPKRASRLDLFNSARPAPLSHISEVDSTHRSSAPRPPFAVTRTDSYGSDGYGTDDGGIMSRARPGEGNTMFGGRQKIYKIPVGQAGSVKNFNSQDDQQDSPRVNMGGKAIYESDSFPSAFQLAREREKQERLKQEAETGDSHLTRSSKEQDRSGSPPNPRYNKNRETTSSTNSGPSQNRASTAATSIASQKSVYGAHEAINGPGPASLDRPSQRGKKLYGQGIEQHQGDPQASLQRINSLNRTRGALNRNLTQSRSATNLNDRFQRNGLRAASPSPSQTPPRMQDFDLGLNGDGASINDGDTPSAKSPVSSPSMTPALDASSPDPTLVAALEPNDLGKATASGAFNKPQNQYNEQQYLQRQLQLQEGRGTPSPVLTRPFSPASMVNEQKANRSRNNSQGSSFSRTNSTRRAWEHHMDDRVLRSVPERGQTSSVRSSLQIDSDGQNVHPGERTFFGGMSGSELGSNPESEAETDIDSPIVPGPRGLGFRQPGPPPVSQTKPVQNNAAFDFGLNESKPSTPIEEVSSDNRSRQSANTIINASQEPEPEPIPNGRPLEADTNSVVSQPNGNGNGHDLSGLVKQHLRNVSNTSSVYPEDSPRRSRHEVRSSIFGHESALNQQESWRESHLRQEYPRDSVRSSDSDMPPVPASLSSAAKHMLEQATALKNQESSKARQVLGTDKAHRVLGDEAPRTSHETNNPHWQEQVRSHHARMGSTETQREREGLANEMEARRRIVMNNLQTFVEGESRDASPSRGTLSRDDSPARSASGFGLLKKGNGAQGSVKAEKPSKALKMLGIDSTKTSDVPPELLLGREQYPDRAAPASQNGSRFRTRGNRQRSESSPSKSRRTFFGSRSNQTSRRSSPQRASPLPSTSGSDGSERPPHSRKGSAGKSTLSSEPSDALGIHPAFDPNRRTGTPRSRDGPSETNGDTLPPPVPSAAARARSRSNSRTPQTPLDSKPSTTSNHSFGSSADGAGARTEPVSPSLQRDHPQYSNTHPTMINPQQKRQATSAQTSPRHGNYLRSGSINKHDISEPTFISSTSTVDTVDLPAGASLKNGMDEVNHTPVPPIPGRDSRRRNIFHAFGGRKPGSPSIPSPVLDEFAPEERSSMPNSTGVAGNEAGQFKGGHRTKRSVSDGLAFSGRGTPFTDTGSFTGDAHHGPGLESDALAATAERHVPYQARQDVPASAVMF